MIDPTPGSNQAIEQGCKCPILDNANGRGYMGVDGVFVINETCPVHGGKIDNSKGGNEK